MYTAKDGRGFASKDMGSSWDKHIAGKPADAMKSKGAPAEEGKEDPKAVVAEHGPAHTTHIMKDKQGDTHTVHSHHEDGHVHKSGGHDVKGAHDHSMAMHGHDEANPEQDNTDQLDETASLDPEAEQIAS